MILGHFLVSQERQLMGPFFMVCNVHGIVQIGVEDDVNSLPAIKGTNIWNENGDQEQIDIQFLSDQEGEARSAMEQSTPRLIHSYTN